MSEPPKYEHVALYRGFTVTEPIEVTTFLPGRFRWLCGPLEWLSDALIAAGEGLGALAYRLRERRGPTRTIEPGELYPDARAFYTSKEGTAWKLD